MSRFPTEAERTRRADFDAALDALDWAGVAFDRTHEGVEGLPPGVSGALNLCRTRTSVVLHPLYFSCVVSIGGETYEVRVPWVSLTMIADARTGALVQVYSEAT